MKLLGKFPRPKQLIGLQFKFFVSFKGPALVEEPKSGPVTLPINFATSTLMFSGRERTNIHLLFTINDTINPNLHLQGEKTKSFAVNKTSSPVRLLKGDYF